MPSLYLLRRCLHSRFCLLILQIWKTPSRFRQASNAAIVGWPSAAPSSVHRAASSMPAGTSWSLPNLASPAVLASADDSSAAYSPPPAALLPHRLGETIGSLTARCSASAQASRLHPSAPGTFPSAASAAPAAPAAPATPAGPAGTPAPALWDETCELVVQLELSRFEGRRASRPYVAVWIEDAEKYPVRTLALWSNGGRWLEDLKGWYRSDQLRVLAENTELTPSVSSATRPAGKYTLKWDGKDNSGKFVKSGKYTICLEAAREHGTYQIMRQELDCNGTAAKVDLKGNVEIASAALDYHHKANAH